MPHPIGRIAFEIVGEKLIEDKLNRETVDMTRIAIVAKQGPVGVRAQPTHDFE